MLGIITLLALIWLVQFAYPKSRALPFATVGGEGVGLSDQKTVASRLAADYSTVPLELKLPDGSINTSFDRAGFSVDTKRAFQDAASYPWWQRLIPFSLLLRGATSDHAVHMRSDKVRYNEFATQAFAKCKLDPINAGVKLTGTTIELAASKDGYSCDSARLRTELADTEMVQKGMAMSVPLRVIKPARTDATVKPLLDSARKALERELTLQAEDGAKPVPKAELASWLKFEEKTDKSLAIALDAARVGAYAKATHSAVIIAPKATVVATLDGVETGRTVGAPGRQIDESKTTANVQKSWLESADTAASATVATQTVAPATTYSRSYSPTQAGLQALLGDIAKDKGDYAIAVRRGGVSAQVNGAKQYHPASTYKMFAAWAVLKRIDASQMSWTDSAEGGKTVAQCFDVMIINSDNPCGEWFGIKIGWTNLNNLLKGIGLTCTNLSTAWVSCAQDQTLFLAKLESGEILSGSSRDRLLDVMKRQVYRSGIPTGVGGTVADKVGFINGYLHDAAIVYAPGGTYEITILTRGSSWSQIADAARQIQSQLNRM